MALKFTFPPARHAAAVALAVLAALTACPALAHGDAQPQHGGIVQVANDVSYELVPQADGVTLYLMDHGKPMASQGIAGKLTVLQGSKKTEVALKEAGGNTLRATGVKVGKGDKLVAALSHVGGKSATVRFTVK